jgi:hypothetical protein
MIPEAGYCTGGFEPFDAHEVHPQSEFPNDVRGNLGELLLAVLDSSTSGSTVYPLRGYSQANDVGSTGPNQRCPRERSAVAGPSTCAEPSRRVITVRPRAQSTPVLPASATLAPP